MARNASIPAILIDPSAVRCGRVSRRLQQSGQIDPIKSFHKLKTAQDWLADNAVAAVILAGDMSSDALFVEFVASVRHSGAQLIPIWELPNRLLDAAEPNGWDVDTDFLVESIQAMVAGRSTTARAAPRRSSATGKAVAPALAEQGVGKSDAILAIGASTGGVQALQQVLPHLPKDCPPTLIVQHMSGKFTAPFAERLNKCCAAEVVEAWDGAPLCQGRVYLAPGSVAHLEVRGILNPVCHLSDRPAMSGHRPSVDVLFQSVASYRDLGIGVLLTGMGSDGAEGLLAMRKAGAMTIAQDEKSSMVYGMPRAASALGAAIHDIPLQKIGPFVMTQIQNGRKRSTRNRSPQTGGTIGSPSLAR